MDDSRLVTQNLNKMKLKIFLEWDPTVGIPALAALDFFQQIEASIPKKLYGKSLETISIIVICRGWDLKQRKRFKKAEKSLYFDILLDYFQTKHLDIAAKKKFIKRQIWESCESTLKRYKFSDFDDLTFLSDLKKVINATKFPITKQHFQQENY